MSNQLVKKNPAEGYQNVFPKTWIDAIKDKESGVSLQEILQGFNMYFLSYNGSRALTRCKVPSVLRKEGLWITYVLYDHTVVTEWYNSDQIDDNSWSMDSNWRVASNNLVGDISVSSDGYWVINGERTEAKAQGEQGITPLLRVGSNDKLQVSYNEGKAWKDISDYIVPKFRWNQGIGTSAGTIQISMDLGKTWTNLSNEITNNLRISRYIGINESLPTSGVAEGTIYMKGPYYNESDTSNTNPIYRMWVYTWKGNTLAWQDNGEFTAISAGVVQERGTSTTEVMSQDAVTRELTKLGQYVDNSEWAEVITDNENKILYGVKTDGKFYFGDGCPPQVQLYITNILGTYSATDYANVMTFLGNLINGETLSTLLNSKVNVVPGKSLVDANYASSQEVIDNEYYLVVETDNEYKILGGRKLDGTAFENMPFENPLSHTYYIDDNIWLEVTIDNEGRILEGIKKDGTKYISQLEGLEKQGTYPTLKGKTIVCFGDSITMFTGIDGNNYPMWMDELSDATVIGCGFGGSRVSSRTTQTLTPSNLTQADAPFDLVNLVTSICGNDYSYLDAGLQYIIDHDSEWVSTQFRDTLDRIKVIDWSKVDCVTVLIGTNDWTASVNPGTPGSSDVTTVLGAINKVIETLLLTYPHLKIYWFTPLLRCIVPDFSPSKNYSVDDVCYYSTNQKYYKFINMHQGAWNDNDVVEISVYEARKPEWWSDILTINGITLKELASDIRDEVIANHIPIDDTYNNLGWNRYNASEYFLDIDATHPYKGFRYIAEKMLGFIDNN